MSFQILNSLDYSKGSTFRPRYKTLYNRVISHSFLLKFRCILESHLALYFQSVLKRNLEVCSVKEK